MDEYLAEEARNRQAEWTGSTAVGPPGQSPGRPLRLPSTSLRSAQGDPSKISLPSGPHPERGPTARGRGPSRGVGSTERLKHLPAFVASQEGGEGFAEIAQTILDMRTTK